MVPPRRTGELQPLDVGINKPFKDHLANGYHEWRGKHDKVTKSGYKKPSKQDFINFVSTAWDNISPDCIRNAFKKSWKNVNMDCLFDDN